VSKNLLSIVSEGKLVSPIHTYPLEHKAIQALFWNDQIVQELGIDSIDISTIRSIFPKTILLSELLITYSPKEIATIYSGYYLKHGYSWCGEKVMKLDNELVITSEIIKECFENPVSWIVQKPADHVHVTHVQYSQWDDKIQGIEMIADSGIQYQYNPSNTDMFTVSCSRNSLNLEKGIVTQNIDNVFRPAIVLISKE
jgi:hypothetical protein